MSLRVRPARLQSLGNRGDRADAHLFRQAAGDGVGYQPRDGLNAELLCAAGFHQNRRGCAVRGLRAVAGGDRALRVEGGLEFGERFGGGVGARAFVGGKDCLRDRRLSRPSRLEREVVTVTGISSSLKRPAACAARALLVAVEGKGVLIFARNLVVAGDTLGGQPHGEQRGRIMLGHPWIGARLETAEGKQAHRFHAAGDDNPVAARPDALIGNRNRFKPRRA